MFARSTFGRALALAAVTATVAAAGARAQQLPPARQVVDRYLEATGAKAAAGRFQSRHMVTEMSMPAMGMTMTMHVYQARPNKLLVRTEMPGMGNASLGFDGTTAWSTNPMQGPRILEDAREVADLLRQAEFDSYDFAKVYDRMETVGERTVAGRPCWNVRMSSTQGKLQGLQADYCFDKETGLAVAATMKQTSQMGEMEIQSVMSDYRDFDGLKMPTRTTSTMMGQEMVHTVKSVTHEPLDASLFTLPPEVQALKGQRQD
ncbi:MAG TPA: DUF4412 domain-containing protein [Longimicrobium sp.]|jgi:hypothetical protein